MKKYHLFKCNVHCKNLHVTDMDETFTSMSELFEQLVVYCNQIDNLMPNIKLFVSFNKSFFSPLNRNKIYQRYKANFDYLFDRYSKLDCIPVCFCTYRSPSSYVDVVELVFLVKVTEE